jgi:hypothetical protein
MSDAMIAIGRVSRLQRSPYADKELEKHRQRLLFRIENDPDPRFFALDLSDEISVRLLLFVAHHGKPIRVTGKPIDDVVKQVTELSIELLADKPAK